MLNPLIRDLELKSSLNIKEKMKNGTKVTDKVTDKNNKKKDKINSPIKPFSQ